MDADGAVLSGSFVLKCITNDAWECNDVDVFLPISSKTLLWDWVPRGAIHTQDNRNGALYKCALFDNHAAITVRDLTWSSIAKLQLICTDVERCELEYFIFTNFDLDVCKNVFTVKDGKPHLSIYSRNSIVQRRCGMLPGRTLVDRQIWRMKKYRERGFDIVWSKKQIVAAFHKYSAEVMRVPLVQREARSLDFSVNLSPYFHRRCKESGFCEFAAVGLAHIHADQSTMERLAVRCVVVSLYEFKVIWNNIVGVALGLFRLRFPTYVLLWIFEKLALMCKYDTANWLSELEVLRILTNINETFRNKMQIARQNRENKSVCL
jgi:hypothetical protein